MITVVFLLSVTPALGLVAISCYSLASKAFQFWPPPAASTWQYRVFWTLFRMMLLGLVTLSVLDFNRAADYPDWLRYGLGTSLLVFGFAAAQFVTVRPGWKNAHGEAEGLKTTGWYRWSRNPVYVVSMIGMAGWGLLVGSIPL